MMVFFCEKYAREIMSCGDLVREYSCEIMSCNSDNDDVIHEYARDIMSCGSLQMEKDDKGSTLIRIGVSG